MSKNAHSSEHYEIDLKTGECYLVKYSYPYRMDEEILIKDLKCLDKPAFYKITGREIVIPENFTYDKNQFEEADNNAKKKYLLDTYTGKYYKIHGRKICIQTYSTHELQAFNLNKLYYSLNDYETKLIRREFIRVYLKELLHKEPENLVVIFDSMYEDGIFFYYKNFLDKEVLKILLNELECSDIKVIYNTCVFAYNNMMNKIEQEKWEELLLDKNIKDLFIFNGDFISDNESTNESNMKLLLDKDVKDLFIVNCDSIFNNKRSTKEPHILPNIGKEYLIKELHNCIGNILGYENYDITKSKYLKGILRSKECLEILIKYDSSQYIAILTNLDKLDIDEITKKNISTNYELFEKAFDGPIIENIYGIIHKYEKTSNLHTGIPSAIIKTVKKYAQEVYEKAVKSNKYCAWDTEREIAIRLDNIYNIGFEYKNGNNLHFFPSYKTKFDEFLYIFLTPISTGVYKEKVTGALLWTSDYLKYFKKISKDNFVLSSILCFTTGDELSEQEKNEYKEQYEQMNEYPEIITEILKQKYTSSVSNLIKIGGRFEKNSDYEKLCYIKDTNEPLNKIEIKSEIQVNNHLKKDESSENMMTGYYVRKK